MTSFLIRRWCEDMGEEGQMKTEGEIGFKLPQAKEHLELSERDKGVSSLEASEKARTC